MDYFVIGCIVVFIYIYLGYRLWKYCEEEYGYNIFGISTILKGIGMFLCGVYGISTESIVLMGLSVIFFLWLFISTWKGTNFLIAIIAFSFQLFAVITVIELLNKITKKLK